VTPAYGKQYAGLIPGASFEPIPHAGHFPHIEQPLAVAAKIAAFAGA
jgi:pimeloyl-ACP methyl ester carboxylesterase